MAAGYEGVDFVALEEDDLHVVGPEAGRFDQRACHIAEEGFGLGIAKDRLRQGGPHHHGEAQCQQHDEPDEEMGPPAEGLDSFSHGSPYRHARLNPR